MKHILPVWMVVLMICALPAAAADKAVEAVAKTPEQQELMKNARLVSLCNHNAVNHVPDADVEYKPGIDAKGNFIVAPDIGVDFGRNIYPLYIPLEINLVERLDLDVPIGIIMNPEIAGIMVYEDGKVTYNGHDISRNVETFCAENAIVKKPE